MHDKWMFGVVGWFSLKRYFPYFKPKDSFSRISSSMPKHRGPERSEKTTSKGQQVVKPLLLPSDTASLSAIH